MTRSHGGSWQRDLSAGTTTAVMLVPQAMAYATLAGLPPIHGLYAALLPPILYLAVGSSRRLSVGPVAMDSLLVAATIAAAGIAADLTVAAAAVLALLVGLLQIGLGLLGLGYVVNFLSRPVLLGFTAAAAILIATSQLAPLLGLPGIRGTNLIEMVNAMRQNSASIHPLSAAVGIGSFLAFVLVRRIPRFPGSLAVVLLAIAASWGGSFAQHGVLVVGRIPEGLPTLSLPTLGALPWKALLPGAVAIALVGYMEAIAVGRRLAQKHDRRLRPNRELLGLGLANVGGGISGGFPVTGGFSRSAVNEQAGATSGWAALITTGWIAAVLLFMTPVLSPLPRPTLAALVVAAVLGLVDIRAIRRVGQVRRDELFLLGLTLATTLLVGIVAGILVGVAASLIWFLLRTTRPHSAILGRLPESHTFRNVRNYPEAQQYRGLLILRIDAQFYFGNAAFLQDLLHRLEHEMADPLQAVIIEAASINQLDTTAAEALLTIARNYRRRSIRLVFATVKRPVMTVMGNAGLVDLLGRESFFLDLPTAVDTVLGELSPGHTYEI